MAKKQGYWRTDILQGSQQRYLDLVLQPALEELRATRGRLQEKMPDEKSGDADIVALFQAEIERVDAMEARLRAHMGETVERFSRRRTQSLAE